MQHSVNHRVRPARRIGAVALVAGLAFVSAACEDDDDDVDTVIDEIDEEVDTAVDEIEDEVDEVDDEIDEELDDPDD
jgi:isopentenyl diphosphate isomerase/L-lactate dehydrogenase-like FMN-dependent dehydrogenase